MTADDTPSININGTSQPIPCGTCQTPIAFSGEPKDETGNIACPRCGNSATAQEAARIAIEYAKDKGQLVLNRLARDAARKSKVMTFSGQTSHDKRYRFIVDLQI